MTYLNTIEADSYEDAENRTEEMIRDGDLIPNDIETEIAEDIIIDASGIQLRYEYNGNYFEFEEDVINALIEDEEIFSFRDWLNDNYQASDIYENTFEDLELQYEDYKENILIWCIQVGRVKEFK
jgi:hypothetical protein